MDVIWTCSGDTAQAVVSLRSPPSTTSGFSKSVGPRADLLLSKNFLLILMKVHQSLSLSAEMDSGVNCDPRIASSGNAHTQMMSLVPRIKCKH